MNPKDIDSIEDPHVRERVWRWYREQQAKPEAVEPPMGRGIPLRPISVDNGQENSRKYREVFRDGTVDMTHLYKGKRHS